MWKVAVVIIVKNTIRAFARKDWKTHENPSHISRFPDPNFNPEPLAYEPEILPTRLWR
jgi:hypothetical protein